MADYPQTDRKQVNWNSTHVENKKNLAELKKMENMKEALKEIAR